MSSKIALTPGNIHNLDKTGYMKNLVDVFGDIDDRKIVLTNQFTMDKTYPQKGGGNVIGTCKVKNEVGILAVIFEISNAAQQFRFNR